MLSHQAIPRTGSLVVYKSRPARVLAAAEKIEIEIEGGQTKRVRPKDILSLHPGPVTSLAELRPPEVHPQEAWELLEGTETDLKELAELLYGEHSPGAAWGAWERLSEGLWFEGTAEALRPRAGELIERDRAEREAKAKADQAWAAMLERLRQGRIEPEDRDALGEVERLANLQGEHSRILKALNYEETPIAAYRLLVSVGYWPPTHNPYPTRVGAALHNPELPIPSLASAAERVGEPERLDLTHLPAFAIDDEGNQDPDDAISLDGDRVWVHVADVAALVQPDSELDREARARGANLYLPEGIIHMLPMAITEQLGLGLQAQSPALSFGLRLDAQGDISDIEIQPTLVQVQRLSYAEADRRLDQAPLADLAQIADRYRQRRLAQGAAEIDLPEVSVRLHQDQVLIRPLERTGSRSMVTELMLMAGEAAARYCQARELPIPYATQPTPERIDQPSSMAGMYAYRRLFKPSRTVVGEPGRHFGLGLDAYTRATSPLRRYGDLLVHQQLRQYLRGSEPLSAEQVSQRAGEADQGGIIVRRAERQSNLHWKLVYLKQQPRWKGEGVVVELQERKAVLLIPQLALETRIRAKQGLALDQCVPLALAEVDLAQAECQFRLLG
ncbi:ribonuclease catalytic domain-containing protein [Halochromatium roseum]|uniref:ribonuclease catalytic domain-containing protein n=1 Tax=Halochromatium roseum TaxID=391920 RepID=UPI0019127304|nr:RNB domain-containing ribonuclease [Halochromatium roseum]MBK5940114.1 exoribonuclease II [Halochromatium roseum]